MITTRLSIGDLLHERGGIRLDIGCGENKQLNFVGMDVRDMPNVDIVHDWDEYPWPLPDECCIQVLASHVVEHIAPARFGFIHFMDEVWRICKADAQFAITTPHGYSPGYLQDPTHVNPCNEATWAYFDPEEPNTGGGLWRIYKPRPWRIEFLAWEPSANIEVILRKRMEVVNE